MVKIMIQFAVMLLSDDADVEFVNWCGSMSICFQNCCINDRKISQKFVSLFLIHNNVSLFVFHYFKSNLFVSANQLSNKNQIYVNFFYHLCKSFESEYTLTHNNLQILHQRHLITT